MSKKGTPPPAESAESAEQVDNASINRFEQSLDELESLVQKMERGDMSLDESLSAYERGISLYRQCQGALEKAELRVKLLSDPLKPETAQDFDED
ncbi:exodeoxyribonuclease VII small subunit [Pseudomarimonas arenosa]|uniref:Exodeoxyribonuclease 7 small subunit n=1 Tax=Pseudomarimonas arenosa TaxID=2774145 RepID=A0AAW3ZR00_9GAMM|nr:exodeoxyribonuclease VII small subunit [Pseudomarimonas arenosa]MBD8527002.1 exodeoxyribonuclease VII small subunit [Pseudomarimonas arenosa]